MKIGYLQLAPVLGDVEQNINNIDRLLPQAKGAELLVLPELSNSGYRFESRQQAYELSETVNGSRFVDFIESKCRESGMHIVVGVNEREGEMLYNTAVLVGPGGLVGKYRKMHLFMDEKDIFEPGDLGFPIFDVGVYRVGMLICFDWVFPEAWRVLALKGADIICHPSNLVIPGLCQKALPVHAVCNRVFVITANRIGTEGDLTFTGLSTVAAPNSDILVQASPDREEVGLVDIDITQARNKQVTPRNHVFDDRRVAEYLLLLEERPA
jgi:predicted amidohydrolase